MRLSPIVQVIVKALPVFLAIATFPLTLHSQTNPLRTYTSDTARAAEHASSDWALVAPHLPDPQTATAAELQLEGDLLRARRFPEDALDYYGYAMKRGADPATVLNRIGVTELEIGNSALARECFERVVKMRRNDPQAWNNLGAVDFLDKQYRAALHDYKRALKLDRRSAVSHSNLGLAYVQLKDYDSARKELAIALRIDPAIFQHSSGSGVSVHMLSTEDRADFAFEMAKVYARSGNLAEMFHSLETAAQAGMDVPYRMTEDRDLSPYVHDARVVKLMLVARSLRSSRRGVTNVADALPPAEQTVSAGVR
jgi:tetratricopeptide (TPR) repeat protein